MDVEIANKLVIETLRKQEQEPTKSITLGLNASFLNEITHEVFDINYEENYSDSKEALEMNIDFKAKTLILTILHWR